MKKGQNFLGKLEKQVMEIIWETKKGTVREVLNHFPKKKTPAYTTIMTVMSRLTEKGVLKRKMVNDSYLYEPAQPKEVFLSSKSKNFINNLFNYFGDDIAIAQFVDHVEKIDQEKLKEMKDKLEKIINKK